VIASERIAGHQSNPFCTRFVRPGSIEYRFAADGSDENSHKTLGEIVGRLDQHRAGLIVGAHGSGKTTLLHSLGPWLSEAFPDIAKVHLFAPPSQRMLDRLQHARRWATIVHGQQARLRDGGLLIIDGLEQLWHRDLRRLLRKTSRQGQTLLATSHSPLAGMTILHRTHVDGKLVSSLARSLLSDASTKVAEIVDHELQRQDWSRLTNVRDLWFELYDIVQPHICQSHVLTNQHPPRRNSHDGRPIVCHHGAEHTADAGCRANSGSRGG
jgi:energy-coupling factor transporter ATP-binding protein EcfA2